MECVKLLDSECSIGRSQLQHFLCCYCNAVANCFQLDRSGPVVVSQTINNSNDDVLRIKNTAYVGVVKNLSTYQLRLKGKKVGNCLHT